MIEEMAGGWVGSTARSARRRTVLAIGTGLIATAGAGCGIDKPMDNAGGDSEGKTAELRCTSNPNDGNCPWKGTWARLLPRNNVDITHNWAPCLIADDPGWVTFTADSTNHFQMLQWHANGRGPNWALIGTRTWNSRPACTMREDSMGLPGFVVAGKSRSTDSFNNKIMASTGRMATFGGPTDLGNPTMETAFAAVDNTNVYATGGLPGLSSFTDNFGGGAVLLAAMGDDGRTVYAYVRNLPYSSNSWSSRITGPVLPANWKVVYAPTVAKQPVPFEIVIHAHNSVTNADALFRTYFYTDGLGTAHFSNQIGSPVLAWESPVSMGQIDDDPWITYSSTFGTTVYFKRGTQMMENAFPPGGFSTLPINPAAGIQFASSPASTADHAFDMGTHVIVARTTSNRIYFHDTNSDANLMP